MELTEFFTSKRRQMWYSQLTKVKWWKCPLCLLAIVGPCLRESFVSLNFEIKIDDL